MSIYRRLVIEEPLLVGAVRDRHDVDILEFRTGFTPVKMGQYVVPADFAAGLALAHGWHCTMLFRRTWPTPSVKIPFAGMIRNFSAPTFWVSNSQCFCSENPRGTFSVVQSLYSEPALTVSVERMTT